MKIKSLSEVKEIDSYLRRIGAEGRSLRKAVVKEMKGDYWRDVCKIEFSKDGTVTAPGPYAPTEAEAEQIKAAMQKIDWPTVKFIHDIIDPPVMIKKAAPEDLFEFRNRDGMIQMLQVKVERPDGKKNYVPWTYWSDDTWRALEPEGDLPLFNEDKLRNASTVFIHEGAKAARYVQWMVEAQTADAKKALAEHPWGEELAHAAHIGWIGGALTPYRVNWSVINNSGINRAYIVADNDAPGRQSVPRISKHLKMPTYHVQFTEQWPASFDLADEFPAKFFRDTYGEKIYIGPAFRDVIQPATWATEAYLPLGAKRPSFKLREHFREQWAYIEEIDMFINKEFPQILRSEAVLNNMLAGFSNVQNVAKMIVKEYRGRMTNICYRPDKKERVTVVGDSTAINLHVPTSIKSRKGDIKPFIEFLEYMFVNEDERYEVQRWLATLIARTDIKMNYGMLLVSEKQGIGKTTLGLSVLQPLVGYQNVSLPSEADIVNPNFNAWLSAKRLIIVNEIYSGHSWKAYNSLKGVITDSRISINQKYMKQYQIENWAHVFACSNSMRCLKMEKDDRRWFFPEVTEVPWTKEQFDELYTYLGSGGLNFIKHWAEGFGDYVHPGERAPMTERKKESIQESLSEAQREVVDLTEAINNLNRPIALTMKSITGWVRDAVQGKVFETDYELRRAMRENGAVQWPKRVKVNNRLQYVMINKELEGILKNVEEKEQPDQIRNSIVEPNDILGSQM